MGTHSGSGRSSDAELLGVEEVADYLGIKPVTVYRWCREGRLPCMKLGRRWRIRRQALEEFLDENERNHPNSSGGGVP